MKKVILILAGVILIGIIFFPKESGGPLCGPVCSDGLHTWQRQCIGFSVRDNYIDGFTDRCFGLPIGERRCFGTPTGSPPNTPDREMSCNYGS